MLLTLRVQSRSGQPLPQPLSADFSSEGGTIGRAKDCHLVLDDPGQIVSRTHASIVYRDGRYYLADMGSNASMINERVLGIGKEEALSDGDRIRIGDYVLEALIEDELKPSDPTVPWPGSSQEMVGELNPFPGVPWPGSSQEIGGGGDTFPKENGHEQEIEYTGGDALSKADILKPGDWSGGEENIDIGLGTQRPRTKEPVTTPNALSPEQQAFPGDARESLKKYLQGEQYPEPVPEPSGNQGDSLTGIFGPDVNGNGKGNGSFGGGRSPYTQKQEGGQAASGQGSRAGPNPKPVNPKPVEPNATTSDGEVLRALLRGMGLAELQLKRSPVEAAELIGAMLREATSGTMEVLVARALIKQENRVRGTVIATRENNPLKFFPDAEMALAQMLNSTAPGYLKPAQAFTKAYSDIKTHEMAVMAGMQSALTSVLARFDPETIERGMSEAGLLEKVLQAHRKAKMWDRMVEIYREVSREADHDFQRLFGERFAAAYEEQVRALQQENKGRL